MVAELSTNTRLLDTQRAFDSVASAYDGPMGNNELIQRMRSQLWQAIDSHFPTPCRLLDLGCGTGIDAAHFAQLGFEVVATDWSPEMVARTRARAEENGLSDRIRVKAIGIQELERLDEPPFDGIYSDLGPLNCVPDLRAVSRAAASYLRPRGRLVASVIGRICPWEFAYYAMRGDWKRARLRGAKGSVPVNLGRQTVWTAYYQPGEFYRELAGEFELTGYRALAAFMPPPYLIRIYERFRPMFSPLAWLDDRFDSWPFIRDLGDHFLMVMTKK